MPGDDRDEPTSATAPTSQERPGTLRIGPSERETVVTDEPFETPSSSSSSSGSRRYELGAEIARGGMGRVVDATDTLLGRAVAVKEALSTDADARRRFTREMRITARLEHPSIVPLYDAGTSEDGSPFYAMRKVTGRPLDLLVKDTNTLDERLKLVPNVLATAQALAHAHERGVIHRDLKPTNILVGSLGETVVIDWGLAKVIGDAEPAERESQPVILPGTSMLTRVGTVFGTPGFMPPEQIYADVPLDARADVYALGATLYYVIARRPPHYLDGGRDMMLAAVAGPPQSLASLVEDVPPELLAIVDKSLAQVAADRYPDAAGFAQDLQRYLTGQLVAAHRYTRRERFARWFRKFRLAIAIAAIAIVTLTVVGTISIVQIVRERNRTAVALHDALDRNEQLVIGQAQSMISTNPTAAVALVKPMALAHWREARAIGMAARSTGVARGLPASRDTLSLEILRDGVRAISAGSDGVVRVHDLVTETSRVIAKLGSGMWVRMADEERVAIAFANSRIAIVDVATGARRDVAAPTDLDEIHPQGKTLWLVGKDGSVWRRTLDDEPAVKLAVDDVIDRGAVSPRGDSIAIAGRRIWVVDAAGGAIAVGPGPVRRFAWSDDGATVAATLERGVILVDAATRTPTEHAIPNSGALAWDGAELVVAHEGGILRVGRGGVSAKRQLAEGSIVDLAFADDALVAGTDAAFTLLRDPVVTSVPPAAGGEHLTARRTSRFVLAVTMGAILVWNIDEILPHAIAPAKFVGYSVLSGDQVIAHASDGSGLWFDLRRGDQVPVAIGPDPWRVAAPPAGDIAVVIGNGNHATIHRRGMPAPLALDVVAGDVMFVTPTQFVLTTTTGDVRLCTLDGTCRALASGPAIRSLEARGGWVVVRRDDNSIWRYRVSSDATSTLPPQPQPRWQVLAADGTVYVTDHARVRAWRTDGTIADHATLTSDALNIAEFVDDTHAFFGTDDIGASIVELGPTNGVTNRFPPGSRMFEWTYGPPLMISRDIGGRVSLHDLTTPVSWRIATPSDQPLIWPHLTADGTRAFAIAAGTLVTWTIEIPRTPDETRAFLDRLTNARAENGRAVMLWQ